MRTSVLIPYFCATLLVAQDLPPDIVPPFVVTTERVVVPATVFDRDGVYVNGLRADQFHLYDNGKEQNIQVDVAF